jgi:two-component system NtrC family sensor kinase
VVIAADSPRTMAGVAMAVSEGARTLLLSRARLISFAMIAISPVITGVMSLLFYREIRAPMLLTSVVCAVVIDRIVQRITRSFRHKLRAAHAQLEQRVRERTAALEQANQELMMRDRMATAGMLAAGVSHEIRSPLTVIRIAVDDISEQLAGAPDDVREQLRDLGDAAKRIELIVNDLGSLARPADDPIVPTDIDEVIRSAARLAAYRFGRGVTFEHVPADVPRVAGNASRLVQVILNLLVNAARSTRDGAPNRIRIGAERRGAHVVVRVSDSGSGMTDETRARLFEPFFTTGTQSGGTGLGLVICRSIVERMDGTIEVTSALDVGTTVEVSLRLAA